MDLDITKFICPAMKWISDDYPARFNRRVPKVIRMLKTVESDVLWVKEYNGLVAEIQMLYPAWTNSYGAVAAVLDDGRKLGVKPDEFEVVEWWNCDP